MTNKSVPMRRCAGCMESKPKEQLIRIAGYEGKIAIDPTGRAKGRGVYLCPAATCFEKAMRKRAIARSLGMELSKEQSESLFEELKKYERKDS